MIEQQAKPAQSNRQAWVLLALNALIFIGMFFSFNHKLPDEMISHYNVSGEADDTMAKWTFWLLYGALGIVTPSLITILRRFDPRSRNYELFNSYFHLTRYAISIFLHGIFLVIILDNLDVDVKLANIVCGGIGLLFLVIGNGMGLLRSNFFIGIRTPWTLSDDDVWRRTHRVSAWLWVISGLLMLIGAFFLEGVGLFVIIAIAIFLAGIFPMIYSFLLYSRKRKQ